MPCGYIFSRGFPTNWNPTFYLLGEMVDMEGAIRLPLRFDVDRLRQDLELLENSNQWHSHPDYTVAEAGDWTAIALISPSGSYDDARSLKYSGGEGVPTQLLADSSYLGEVVGAFKTRVHRARLMNLKPGTQIREHRDYGSQRYSFERGFIRVHIPIRTHEKAAWRLRRVKIHMQPGESWYLNVCLPHSVENLSEINRVHLVLDMEVNDWVRTLFPAQSVKDMIFGRFVQTVEPSYLRVRRRAQPLYWKARETLGDLGLRRMRDALRDHMGENGISK